jgi:hypothetical protein
MSNDANEPIMTDLDAEQADTETAASQRKSWLVRFASIFGLASAGQGSGPAGMSSNGTMGV